MAYAVPVVYKTFRGVGDHTLVLAKITGPASYTEATGYQFTAADLAALGLTDVDWVSSNYNGNQADGAAPTHITSWDADEPGLRIFILEAGATATDEFANAGDASALKFDVLIVGGGILDA